MLTFIKHILTQQVQPSLSPAASHWPVPDRAPSAAHGSLLPPGPSLLGWTRGATASSRADPSWGFHGRIRGTPEKRRKHKTSRTISIYIHIYIVYMNILQEKRYQYVNIYIYDKQLSRNIKIHTSIYIYICTYKHKIIYTRSINI